MILIRSILFNIAFYVTTTLVCLAFIPTLLLSRSAVLWVTRLWVGTVHFLEKHIAGLDFEIRGAEHLPKDQSYIVLKNSALWHILKQARRHCHQS